MTKPPPDPEWESRPAVAAYRAVELKLGLVREKNLGEDSPEEDDVLDESDVAWWALSQDEMEYIRKVHGPHYDFVVKYLKPLES